ncbi:AraC family transcriptional regulator [Pseudomonas sp. BRG-100]|uniref:AraC family transcriptional regulator n=1 Tax=Pseudomonas sp. BRG-100 TaxID=1524267 RepID=UPI0009E08771|nr:AraC family transcriptional regulator [Pseudomonas sp. BRG-100]
MKRNLSLFIKGKVPQQAYTDFYSHQRLSCSAKIITQWALGKGADLKCCLKNTDLTLASLTQPNIYISSEQELILISNIVNTLELEPLDGLNAGLQYSLSLYGAWGFTMLSSPTLHKATTLGLRYLKLTYAFTRFSLQTAGPNSHILAENDFLPETIKDFILNRDIGAILRAQRDLTKSKLPFNKVNLTCSPPKNESYYTEEFGVTPNFKQQFNTFTLPTTLLSAPLSSSSPEANHTCVKECETLIKKTDASLSYISKVNNLLSNSSEIPSMEQVAELLNLSSRTLRRNLEKEGATYRTLLDSYRKNQALALLEIGGISIQEISYLLGYSDPSNFAHSFKRWHGVSITNYNTFNQISHLPTPPET